MIETSSRLVAPPDPAVPTRHRVSPRLARLPRLMLLAFAFAAGLTNLRDDVGTLFSPQLYLRDFIQDYVLIRAIAAGGNPLANVSELIPRYVGVPSHMFPHPTPHPPTMALFLVPFVGLSYPTAALAWFILQLAGLLTAIVLLHRLAGRRPVPLVVVALAVVLVAWFPVQYDLRWANVSIMILVLLVGMFLASRRDRYGLAGALLGLTLLIKPIAWPILLAFAIKRQWRAVTGATVIGGAGVGITAAVIGIPRLISYVTVALPTADHLYEADYGNSSLSAVAWHLFFGGTAQSPITGEASLTVLPLRLSETAAEIGAVILPLLALLLAGLVIVRWLSLEWSIALAITVSTVINPISWEHENVLLLIPMTLVAIRHLGPSRGSALAASVVASLTLLFIATENWMLFLGVGFAPRAPLDHLSPFSPVVMVFLTVPTVAVILFAVVLSIAGKREGG